MTTLRSTNGLVEFLFALDADGAPTVAVRLRGREMLLPSRLGLVLRDAPPLKDGFDECGVEERNVDSTWRPVYGEREVVVDRFHEATIRLRERIAPGRMLELVLRCYDEGAAWRYQFAGQVVVLDERSEYRFPAGTEGYFEAHMEGEYERLPVGEFPATSERPLTLVYPHGKSGCLLEAGNVDWPRMRLSSHDGGLRTVLDGPAEVAASCASPWRALVVADRPADLPLRSDLVLNLSPPCALADTSWIRPGKAIREVTLSTVGGKECVDFAAAHGLQYVEYDAGWYGHEYDEAADARTVAPDPERTAKVPAWSGLDLSAVIAHAASKGIGVWLYVNRRALERQLDELLPLYASWGVVGIKAGFVRVGPQEWTMWVHDLVRKAAVHRLMVDLHDEYRPTGLSRTYPNLLTQEGVRGNEHMPTAAHNCTLPFTRAPSGAYDYTYCYGSPRIRTTHAHQLALAVVCYSPLGFFFWYDRPQGVEGRPGIDFWRDVPTTWDETCFPSGEIGEFVHAARRSGSEWFVGVLTNGEAREPTLRFDFLDASRSYRFWLYRDGQPGEPADSDGIVIERGILDRRTRLRIALAAAGGCAMRLEPAG